MAERWTLSRAGIINVYQYEQETLHFGGGRLLLRGVNGSGKSTAMNMLLPFLLDGDPRRIDAAGDQSGVLRSWMLSGRDDPQPIGYLWLELARGTEHLSFGCGIKANRSTDNVTTWWWVTERRPGIDLDLVEGAHPLSAEALRAAIAPDPLFRHDERPRYRQEIRQRLWGGADLDQHIRLLHIVRNPRVGDQVHQDLPAHLHDALPELSERALLEAAQPLDDLEEHRTNVEELRRTSVTLAALCAGYRDYARADLHRRAAQAREVVTAAERAARDATRAVDTADRARAARHEAEGRVRILSDEAARLDTELDGLRASSAYEQGQGLEEVRRLVRTLASASERAAADRDRRAQAVVLARRGVADGQRAAADDHRELARRLADLAAGVVPAGLPLGPPDLPPLVTEALDDDLRRPGPAVGPGTADRLEELRFAVVHRRGDVAEVRKHLGELDASLARLVRATDALHDADNDAAARHHDLAQRRTELAEALGRWRRDVAVWLDGLDEHRRAHHLAPAPPPDLGADVAARRDRIAADLARAADEVADHHRGRLAAGRAQRDREQEAVDAASAVVAELAARQLPDPPVQPWQRPDRAPVLAECVEFRSGSDDAGRAGLEAALEAAGLLGAEVTDEGLQPVVGALVTRSGRAVADPLARLLVVSDDLDPSVDRSLVEAVLAGVSLDPADLGADGPGAVVTTSGRFRVGLLAGGHAKERAEHIGVAARRAALDRQRAAAGRALEAARLALAGTDRAVAATAEALDRAVGLRESVPSTSELGDTVVAAELAGQVAARAEEVLVERRERQREADRQHAEAVTAMSRSADSFGLPHDRVGLDEVAEHLGAVDRATHRVDAALTQLTRTGQSWAGAADRWVGAAGDLLASEGVLAGAIGTEQREAARLATIEDSIGVEYREVLAAIAHAEGERERTTSSLEAARGEQLARTSDASAAASAAEALTRDAGSADGRCAALLPGLRRALAIPGLLDAATDHADALRTPVETSTTGLRTLAAAITSGVPPAERPDATADGVRQSLRQRRDGLGAGWDAEDRQGDGALPLAIEVNGPAGRYPLVEAATTVERQLAELSALLTNEQDHALRNLLQGLVAHEVAEKLHAAAELVDRMNHRLETITTTHGIGVKLRWRRRDGLDGALAEMVDLLAVPPDLRTLEQGEALRRALGDRLATARADAPDAPYRDLIAAVLDYRDWYDISLLLRRPGRDPERLTRRTPLSEGEKKIVSYLPLFAAVAASCDALAETAGGVPRFVLLDDAFAKVSEDNHAKLFGLLVELDLDFIATSERLWGTHATVPELAITEVLRDASLGAIVLEHSHWDGATRSTTP